MKADRVIVLVMDSVGIGELPDAGEYGDGGSNTMANTAKVHGGLALPNLQALGIGNLTDIPGVPPVPEPLGAFGRMGEAAKGKDTTTGHWEMMGVVLHKALPTYPNGFPADIVDAYERAIGRGILGNTVASGTGIIDRLGEEHVRTGKPIVYTSADSVFQVAAHEGVIPIDELYRICVIARGMLTGEHNVARVIARPFTGEPGAFKRTGNRRDFSLQPMGTTVLDALVAAGTNVYAIGKIEDIFANRGMTGVKHTKGNQETLEETVRAAGAEKGLIFANAVDFDMLYGHRNDAKGYAEALEALDAYIPRITEAMGPGGILFITADHGCDPTTPSTDHSREYVPILACGGAVKPGTNLGTRGTFADLGATVADVLGVPWNGPGTSFAPDILGVRR